MDEELREQLVEDGAMPPRETDVDRLLKEFDRSHVKTNCFPLGMTEGQVVALEAHDKIQRAVPYVTRLHEDDGGVRKARSFVVVTMWGNVVAFHVFEDAYDVVYEAASCVEPGKPHVLRAKDCMDRAKYIEELDDEEPDPPFEYHEDAIEELAQEERDGEFNFDPPL